MVWYDPKRVKPADKGEYLCLFPLEPENPKEVTASVCGYFRKGDFVEYKQCKECASASENIIRTVTEERFRIYADEDSFWELSADGSWVVHPMLWTFLPDPPFGYKYWKEDDE